MANANNPGGVACQDKMLRISIINTIENAVTLHVEGQIVGAWTNELAQACEPLLADHRKITLDLRDVSLIDRPGFALLASLSKQSVSLARCSAFQEEQIRRVAAIDGESRTLQ